jgi:MFS family permease
MARSALWHNRDYQVLCVSQGLSRLGTQISTIALPLLALDITGSAAKASVVLFAAGLVEAALLLPGGAIADRWHRRAIAIFCDAASLAAMALLAVAVLAGGPSLALLVVTAVVVNGFGAVFYVAGASILRAVVPDDQLSDAIAVNQARNAAAYLAGPMLGGLLYQIGPAVPFVVDAVTFGVSLIAFVSIRTRLSAVQRDEPTPHLLKDLGAGLAFLLRNAGLRSTLLVSATLNFVFGGIFFAVIMNAGKAGSGVSAGFVIGCAGAGSLLGSLLAVRAKNLVSPRGAVVLVAAASAALTTIFATGVGPVGQAVVLAVCSALIPTMNVVIGTSEMLLTPTELQGRIQSAVSFLALCLAPLSPLVAGALLGMGPPQLTFLVLSALLGGVALFSAVHRAFADLPDPRTAVAA